jgi:NTP pyrophosphatase (non-canonical NTP hydrolase)
MKNVMDRIIKFRDDRDWAQFHTPDNLAKSLVIEASELLELFQWSNDVDKERLSEELADVFVYALLLLKEYNLDFNDIILSKIDKNEKKYPVDKAYGRSTKYNKL